MIAFNIMAASELVYLKNLIPQLAMMGDEIYVVNSESTDGTWEWLNDNKVKYNIRPYQRKFDWHCANQRNFILDKTPEKCWVFRIDCDELPSIRLRDNLKKALIDPPFDRALVRIINLHEDFKHCDTIIGMQLRLFWKDNNCVWKDKTHERLDGDFKKTSALINFDSNMVHFKFLDKHKRCDEYVKHEMYEQKHYDSLANPAELMEVPKEFEYDISEELKEYLCKSSI